MTDKTLTDFFVDLLNTEGAEILPPKEEEPAPAKKPKLEELNYTQDDWDRWEREVIKDGEDLIRECKDM